jgi:hypothetical protein
LYLLWCCFSLLAFKDRTSLSKTISPKFFPTFTSLSFLSSFWISDSGGFIFWASGILSNSSILFLSVFQIFYLFKNFTWSLNFPKRVFLLLLKFPSKYSLTCKLCFLLCKNCIYCLKFLLFSLNLLLFYFYYRFHFYSLHFFLDIIINRVFLFLYLLLNIFISFIAFFVKSLFIL